MKINRSQQSPNFEQKPIPVEFIVIHYTACSLQSTLAIFADKGKKVSSHIVIAEDGEIYEIVKCMDNDVYRAWHAGKSVFELGGKGWESFNDFSIGIEIVNLNGNLFEYSEKQYESLAYLIDHFKSKFKALEDPNRIIGHEQIAKARGKVDPGWKFDWERIYTKSYPGKSVPERTPNLRADILESSKKIMENLPPDESVKKVFWESLNETMEETSKLANTEGTK